MEYHLLCGDVIDQLRLLRDGSVNTVMTSPPYYGLRDYGVDGQIGLEETPDEYIDRLVDVFREVKRVLRDDGILWVNIGDSYNASGHGRKADGSIEFTDKSSKQSTNNGSYAGSHKKTVVGGCKPKDLIGIPWMLAFALRADGWYLRQDIIWAKNNPMPESVRDRCTRSHEYIFMLTKSRRYYFDYQAMQEPAISDPKRYEKPIMSGSGEQHGVVRPHSGPNTGGMKKWTGFRNKRDVWNVSVCSSVKEAHFAVFPKELIEPCIMAGCPEGGWVLDPFSGSGTTGIVAINHGRNYIGIELNPEYNKIAERRVQKECTNAFTVGNEQ